MTTMTKAARPVRRNEHFVGIRVPEEVFESDLFDCSFEQCSIPTFDRRALKNVTFTGCAFTGAELSWLRLQGRHIKFIECNLQNVKIDECISNWRIYVKNSNLRGLEINMSDLDLEMVNCDLTGAALTCSRLNIVADQCNLSKTRFNGSSVSGTFTNCKLPFAKAKPQNLPSTCSARQIRCTEGGTFLYGGDGDPVFTPQKEE